MEWLGTQQSAWDREKFPEGTLNAAQLNELFSIDDSTYGRMVSLYGVRHPAPILKLTEEITEVHIKMGHRRAVGIWDRQAVIWVTNEGIILATCIQIGEQNHRTQKFDPDTVEGYLWPTAEKHRFGKEPETVRFEHGMFSLGNAGAVPNIRQYIKEHYVNKEVNA